MVQVPSSQGGLVQVEIKGIAETIDFLRRKGIEINNKTDLGLVQASNFMAQEVQESITGARAEPRSVNTGTFANSITVDKVKDKTFKVHAKPETYPDGTTTTEVALALEYGTSRIAPRMHFRNSLFRNKIRAEEIVKKAVT